MCPLALSGAQDLSRVHSGCWQSPALCNRGTRVPTSLLVVSQAPRGQPGYFLHAPPPFSNQQDGISLLGNPSNTSNLSNLSVSHPQTLV